MYPLIAYSASRDYYSSPTDEVALTSGILIPSSTEDIQVLDTTRNAPRVGAFSYAPQGSKLPQDETSTSILARIAMCESGGDLRAKNSHSSATGKYQFLASSWQSYGLQLWGTLEGHSIFAEKDQDELAEYVVSKVGYTPWLSSASCWQ